MRLRACIALLLFLSACATSTPAPGIHGTRSQRLTNLQRAAKLPWTDGGQCVVREASRPWPVLVERCYRTLDHDRLEFHDTTGRCAVASTDAVAVGIGFCVLAAPEIAVGAVIVLGVVVVGVAIKEALDAYELRHAYPEEAGTSRGTKVLSRDVEAQRKPMTEPDPAGQDWFPPAPPNPRDRGHHPECKPQRVNHRGGNDPHNKCADRVPNNSFPGWDVFVNGKNFDALQLTTRTLWEVKTDNFNTYSDFLRGRVLSAQVAEMRIERDLARACGFDFRIGVRSEAHKEALGEQAPDLSDLIVVMDWC
ncbi:DUF6310 domain-containing protein [Corallococcus sp. AS-1-12]|uniref:DUF6310 domain-containing protein n=1 Tax=Corallococcus sp. AS-1-12 TaxID=2874598 RepID=UPI001CBB4373|nr:DUF6310 domain-containing protein [Corallococcus sp. AS-1-12]MBZ4333448.1 DUF6310 domain-containing protein [Corallococcus sp. AS-1-12]